MAEDLYPRGSDEGDCDAAKAKTAAKDAKVNKDGAVKDCIVERHHVIDVESADGTPQRLHYRSVSGTVVWKREDKVGRHSAAASCIPKDNPRRGSSSLAQSFSLSRISQRTIRWRRKWPCWRRSAVHWTLIARHNTRS